MNQMTPKQIANLVEFGEAMAWEDTFLSIPAELMHKYNVRFTHIGSAAAFTVGGLDAPYYSRVLGLGVREPATEAMIDECLAFFQAAGSKTITITLSPLARPSTLADWLLARGFSASIRWAKMYRGPEPPPAIPSDLRIECAGPEHALAFALISGVNFGTPGEMAPLVTPLAGRAGWRLYLAWDGNEPVATGALFTKDRVGWLGWGTTLESHRRRGAQGAIMAQRIQDGIALGCAKFITEAVQDTPERPNPSYHNMVRTGFELAYIRPEYVRC